MHITTTLRRNIFIKRSKTLLGHITLFFRLTTSALNIDDGKSSLWHPSGYSSLYACKAFGNAEHVPVQDLIVNKYLRATQGQ